MLKDMQGFLIISDQNAYSKVGVLTHLGNAICKLHSFCRYKFISRRKKINMHVHIYVKLINSEQWSIFPGFFVFRGLPKKLKNSLCINTVTIFLPFILKTVLERCNYFVQKKIFLSLNPEARNHRIMFFLQ